LYYQNDDPARQPLIAARAGLTGGDIHRDFKTKTHIGEARGGPLHTRPPRWWFNRAFALYFKHAGIDQYARPMPRA
jgi:hypothetical protein